MAADQASKLREESARRAIGAMGPEPRVIAITSGKGGVGKTNLTANLGICLAEQGHGTALDADLGAGKFRRASWALSPVLPI